MFYLKLHVLMLADVFENFVNNFTLEYKIISLYSYSVPGYTWKSGLKHSNTVLDYIREKYLLLLLENNIRGVISRIRGDRFFKSVPKNKHYI